MLFGRDPGKAVAKARQLLDGGDALAALRMALKVQERARPPLSGELAEVAEQARRRVVEEALERAEASAAEGLIDDASEWLRGALDHAAEGEEREGVHQRLADLQRGSDDPVPTASTVVGSAADGDGDDRTPQGAELETADHLYEMYTATLRLDLGPLYADRPERFRRAVVALNEGELLGETAQALVAMAEDDPADAVLRLERGRLHHARGELEAALPDLAMVAEALGDEPLDGTTWELSIAALWCDASSELGDHPGVLERLESLGEITLRDPYLTTLYADALIASDEGEDALRFLTESVAAFPNNSGLAVRLANLERGRGNVEGAIAVLEANLERACSTGGCSPSDLEPWFLRMLFALYLERGGPVERAGDVLRMLRAALGDRLDAGDWELVARFRELSDDPDEAAVARSHAARLAAAEAQMPAAPEEASTSD